MIFASTQFRLQISYLPSVFTLDLLENGDVTNGGKQQYAGPDFDSIATKNVINRNLAIEDCLADFNKPFPQHRMLNVSLCFFSSIDAIELRDLRFAKTFHLREHIPYPVPPLMPSPHFLEGFGISASTIIDAAAVLSMNKSQKVAIAGFVLLFFFHNLQLA